VQVTNAHPPGTYTATVRALDGGGLVPDTTATFTLNVAVGTACTGDSIFINSAGAGVDAGPGSVAIGDFNSDGKQDIATANFSAGNVSIRLGDGSGGFNSSSELPAIVHGRSWWGISIMTASKTLLGLTLTPTTSRSVWRRNRWLCRTGFA
jgi:hypothetical protein